MSVEVIGRPRLIVCEKASAASTTVTSVAITARVYRRFHDGRDTRGDRAAPVEVRDFDPPATSLMAITPARTLS